jgi:Domain of unknown function (DUF5615)
VLKFAQAEDRILLTFDKDFGELAFVTELPATSGIILFWIQSPSSFVLTEKIITAIELLTDWTGHFSTIDNNKIRMRELLSAIDSLNPKPPSNLQSTNPNRRTYLEMMGGFVQD